MFHDYWARALVTGDWSLPGEQPDPEIRTTPYLRPPGYPFFLALVYFVTGPDYLWARIAQMGIGLASCVLAFLLARSLFGRAVGLIVAALMAGHWAFIYYEGELQEPFLLVFLALAAVLVLHRWAKRPALWSLGVAGLLLGFFALARANVLLFIPLLVVWVAWVLYRKNSLRRFALSFLMLAAGVALAIMPGDDSQLRRRW